MSATAVTPKPANHFGEIEALKERILKSKDPKLVKALLSLASEMRPKPQYPVPRTDAGGIAEAMSLDDILEATAERDGDEWIAYPGRYYFSKIGNCFRKEWYNEKAYPCNHDLEPKKCKECRFDPGKSEPGHAVEDHIKALMERVYTKGKPGSVLKDMRISEAIQVEFEVKGKTVTDTVYIVGKTDTLVMGDNFEVLNFDEMKTPIFWPKVKSGFIEKYGKIAPLSLVGIGEPKNPGGLVNINNAMQLAVGVHIISQRGLKPKRITLTFVNRERYREHLVVVFTPEEIEVLHDLSVMWVTEHHINMQSEVPPAPEFWMGYECRNCPFAQQCVKDGGKRTIHPAVIGLNARVLGKSSEADGERLIDELEKTLEANAKKPRKKADTKAVKTAKALGVVHGVGPDSAMDQD